MQLRARDGNGMAITAKDGIWSAEDFLKQEFERPSKSPKGVQAGKIYKLLKDNQANPRYVKLQEYDEEEELNNKVPEMADSVWDKVKEMVDKCFSPTGVCQDFDKLEKIEKFYVGRGLMDQDDFDQILFEAKVISKPKPGVNTTNYNELQKTVRDFIAIYRNEHPNKSLDLKSEDYKRYINVCLKRVKQKYMKDDDVDIVAFTGNDQTATTSTANNTSVYSYYTGTAVTAAPAVGSTLAVIGSDKLQKNADPAKNQFSKAPDAAALKIFERMRDIIKTTTLQNSTTPLAELKDAKHISGENYANAPITVFSVLTQSNKNLVNLKAMIEKMYNIFIKETNKIVEKTPSAAFNLADGSRRRHGSRGVAKPKKDGSRRRMDGRSKRKCHNNTKKH